jgi:hypothetical protein
MRHMDLRVRRANRVIGVRATPGQVIWVPSLHSNRHADPKAIR